MPQKASHRLAYDGFSLGIEALMMRLPSAVVLGMVSLGIEGLTMP